LCNTHPIRSILFGEIDLQLGGVAPHREEGFQNCLDCDPDPVSFFVTERLMRQIHTICLIVAVGCLMGAAKSDPQSDSDKQKLLGKWEVVSVQLDGKAQHGQVGRKPGDVISIALDNLGNRVFG
jgi:hypothetical protein